MKIKIFQKRYYRKPKKEYKSHKNKPSIENKPSRKKYRKSSSKTNKPKKKDIICYKCGRPGHYSTKCKMK